MLSFQTHSSKGTCTSIACPPRIDNRANCQRGLRDTPQSVQDGREFHLVCVSQILTFSCVGSDLQ
mgnify:CR=1 FL=1